MTKPERIDVTPEELDALLKRVESGSLSAGDYELIKAMVETITFLSEAVDKKGVQLKRLLRALFGSTSEKAKVILDGDSDPAEDESDSTSGGKDDSDDGEGKKRGKGNGKRPASDYTGAETITVKHGEHKPGDQCPDCTTGVLYEQKLPGKIVRVRGTPPVKATVYELQKLRCGLCGKIFTASPPEGIGTAKYDGSVVALIALLKYGMGLPFYRLEKLQDSLGVPLPSSTQWDILNKGKEKFQPVLDELFRQAACGDVVHNDDTNVKILELMGKRREKREKRDMREDSKRTGMFTSGIVSRTGERTIALYFSGARHAGENLDRLLALRPTEKGRPIQMCDGLDRNVPKKCDTLLANCLVHGRRQFLDVLENFPLEVRHVIEVLGKVYKVDDEARKDRLTPGERLRLHQRKSKRQMQKLKSWLNGLIDKKQVEPNSTLGDAIGYMLKRWDALTLFLREPGAPLDNNICERLLKKAILHRKNALFFRSENGAEVGDLFMSLIHSAGFAKADPFDYLCEIQRNAASAAASPSDWMPWSYRATLEGLTAPPAPSE